MFTPSASWRSCVRWRCCLCFWHRVWHLVNPCVMTQTSALLKCSLWRARCKQTLSGCCCRWTCRRAAWSSARCRTWTRCWRRCRRITWRRSCPPPSRRSTWSRPPCAPSTSPPSSSDTGAFLVERKTFKPGKIRCNSFTKSNLSHFVNESQPIFAEQLAYYYYAGCDFSSVQNASIAADCNHRSIQW